MLSKLRWDGKELGVQVNVLSDITRILAQEALNHGQPTL